MAFVGNGGPMIKSMSPVQSTQQVHSYTTYQQMQSAQLVQMPVAGTGEAFRTSGAGSITIRDPSAFRKPSSRHSGIAEEATQKVHLMHAEMRMVEDTISQLSQENERLKFKLLKDRSATLEKYFMTSDHLLKQACIGEWKRVMECIRRQRDIEGVEGLRIQDRLAYDTRIAQLELQNRELKQKEQEARNECDDLHQRLEQAEALIRSVGEQLGRYPLPPPQDLKVPLGCDSSEYCKSKLHDLLRDIDPRYLPPLQGLSVAEVVAQERLAYAQGTVMHVPPVGQTVGAVTVNSTRGVPSHTIQAYRPAGQW